MLKKFSAKTLFSILFFILVSGIFFYPVVTKGYIPFPGDLLMAEYQPWRSIGVDGYNPGSVPNKAQYFDPLRQMYPWRTFALNTLKNGEFPLWNPHNLSGSPLLANFQSALLYPLNILYVFFTEKTTWTMQVILQPFFSLFMVFYLTKKYKMSRLASILASISYSFSLFMTSFLEYNLLGHYLYLIPLGLLAIEFNLENKRWSYLLLTTVIALAGVAGHLQLFGITIFYLLLYLLIRAYQEKSKTVYLSLLFIVCGVAVAATQLAPGIELITQSARSSHPSQYFITNLLVRPEQLILYLIPDLFGNPATRNYLVPYSYPSKALSVGIATFILAIFSVFIKKQSNTQKTIFLVTGVIFLFVYLNPFSYIFYKLGIPIISSSSPSNYIFLMSLGVSILGGFGLDYLLQKFSKRNLTLLVIPWSIYGFSIILIGIKYIPYNLKNLLLSTAILIFVSVLISLTVYMRKHKISFGIMLIGITCVELFFFFHKFNPFVPKTYIFPAVPVLSWLNENAGIDRFWGYGSAAIEANFATQTLTYSPDGYDPLYPKRYGEFIQSSKDGTISSSFDDTSRSDAVITPGFGKTNMMDNPNRLKILSILGVKYILDKTENGSTTTTFPSEYFTLLESLGDFHVLAYKNANPRVFLTDSIVSYNSKEDFANKLFDPSFDTNKSILIANAPDFSPLVPLSVKDVHITHYKPSFIEIKTNGDAPAFLYLSDTNYPGWEAYIDNVKTPIYQANFTFRSVLLSEGEHIVKFVYKPKSVIYGIIFSIGGIIVTITSYLFLLKIDKPKFGKIK